LKLLQDGNTTANSTSNTTTKAPGPGEVGYVPPLVSGNKVDFNVYILDQDGNIYTSDSKSKASLQGNNNPLSTSSSEDDEDISDLPITTNDTGGTLT
jgi:hypothetical protein